MKNNKIIYRTISTLILSGILLLTACSDSVLDRPQLNDGNDQTYWTTEENVRMYANEFYTQFFVGYNSGWGVDYTPVRGFVFNDDVTTKNVQILFESSIPATRGNMMVLPNSTSVPGWLRDYSGPNWYFGWVRKANLMLNRLDSRMKTTLSTEAFNHWNAVGRFFRALDYCRLVSVFGDVPYYDREVSTTEVKELYKDRTPRNEVMDAIYSDFKFVLENIRTSDGNMTLNRDVAAAFISRWMLFEGTWQKYHAGDNIRAQKFLEFSIEASQILMNSGKYAIDVDTRTLFGSQNLAGNKECIMYRHYDAAQSVTHHIASYSNTKETPEANPNLDLVKAFICNDGKVWQNSGLTNAEKFDIENLVKTRDPRFEASFANKPRSQSTTLLYTTKFIDRTGPTYADSGAIPSMYDSNTNTNDAPVIRFGEVLLNWIEAKAELASMGGTAVTQADIDKSINALRNRLLAPEAIAKGVAKTEPLKLASFPVDPKRDPDVPALIWEIRRERRMELFFEHSRLLDLKRWKKINYMKTSTNKDLLTGIWCDIPAQLPELVADAMKGKTQIMKADGTIVVFNGTNKTDMVGYYLPEGVNGRDDFTDKVYLAPVGKDQIDLYASQGYTLTQTNGWN